MLNNKPITIILVARMTSGQPADGKVLGLALYNQIGDQVLVSL